MTVEVDAGQTDGLLLRTSSRLVDSSNATAALAKAALAVLVDPALELAVETNSDPVDDGGELTVTFTVTNASVQTLTGVVLETLIPGFMSIITATETSPAGMCLSGSTNCSTGTGIQWNLGDLSAGQSVEVTLTDTLSSIAGDGEFITVIARAFAAAVSDAENSLTIVVVESP